MWLNEPSSVSNEMPRRKRVLDNPIERRLQAKKIVDDSGGEDPTDVLTPWERELVGPRSVDIRFPLLDPVMVRRHLAMMEETCHELRRRMEGRRQLDRTHLHMVRGALRQLHLKMNAYRKPRGD